VIALLGLVERPEGGRQLDALVAQVELEDPFSG